MGEKIEASIAGVTTTRLAKLTCHKRNKRRDADDFKRFSEDMRLVNQLTVTHCSWMNRNN
jgi:hypothetical protein